MAKKKKNPYIEKFLTWHPMWSADSACHGEAAWDAAINSALSAMEEHRFNKGLDAVAFQCAMDSVKALRSTKQR